MMSTEELLAQYRASVNGSRVHLRNAIVERYVPWLQERCRYFARDHGGDHDDLWDAGVEALIRGVESYPGKECSLNTWLSHCCRNAMRKVAGRRRQPEQLPEGFDCCARASSDMDAFAELLAPLPTMERCVVLFRMWLNMNYRQIGNIIGCSVYVVSKTFRRAVARIRRQAEAG